MRKKLDALSKKELQSLRDKVEVELSRRRRKIEADLATLIAAIDGKHRTRKGVRQSI